MTGFIIGTIIGGTFGVFIAACCRVAGQEDEEAERTLWPEDKQHSGLLEDD